MNDTRGEMSTAELQERSNFEIEIVEQWRVQSLARAGYDSESAAVLGASHEVDLHERDALARARVLRRSRPADPPLGADPPAPRRPAGNAGRQPRLAGCERHCGWWAEYGRVSFLASIPSPSSGAVDLGPFQIHMYGLTLLVAIAVCIWITGHRYVNRGGDWDLIFRCAVWGVGAGIVGARLYHLATSWNEVPDSGGGRSRSGRAGSASGAASPSAASSAAIVAKRAGADVAVLADCLAPGLLVAQGIGRIGNWWNQELYGKATDLPWGLEIDPAHRPLSSITQGTYHPTFLYELLWDLLAAALLVFVIERRFRPRPPGLFALYIALYSFGRFWVELLRDRPREPHPRPPRQHVGLRDRVHRRRRLVRALQRRGRDPGQASGRRFGRRRAAPAPPAGPKMAVPKGRVRPGG